MDFVTFEKRQICWPLCESGFSLHVDLCKIANKHVL